LRELEKEATTATFTMVALMVIDIKVLNKMPGGKNLGPLRKFGIISALMILPAGWFTYTLTNEYMRLKKHLVTRYLIQDDLFVFRKDKHTK
jgi:hypothetical protein